MKDGQKILIKDMGTSHIKNTIKMLKERTLPNLQEQMEMYRMFPCDYNDVDCFETSYYNKLINAEIACEEYIKVLNKELLKRENKK
jgi:hypothetical protein